MATIKDVAREAGVSIATVSYALNKTRPINPETAARVLQAIEKLHYRPNRAAQSLVTKSTKTISILVSDISNSFFSGIVRGIEDVVNTAGYMVMIGNIEESFDKAQRYLESVTQLNVDGLIISPSSGFEKLEVFIRKLDTPVILVNRRLETLDFDTVITDNEKGAYLATKHLSSLGHTVIGLILGPTSVSTYADRLRGYQRALKEVGIPIKKELILVGGFQYESGTHLAKQLLTGPGKPTALFVGSGLLTRGVYQAIKELEVCIPQELSFITFDEPEWASFVDPPLTTMAQPTYEMGKQAGELLLKRLTQKKPALWWEEPKEVRVSPPVMIKLEPNLIIRKSTRSVVG